MKYTSYLNDENPRVELNVGEYGTIVLELFPKVAPISAKNFVDLVEEGFYDGLIFHRVIEGFMIQGGDPTGTGAGGSKNKIKGEFMRNGVKNTLEHTRGVISMARTNIPDSASSQFFICRKNAPHLDGSYAAFGVVVEGLEAVDKIAVVQTNYMDKPLKDVVIVSAKRVR